MKDHWRINFPVLQEPWSREKVLVIYRRDVEDARPGVPPTMCSVVGMSRSGRFFKFMVPIDEYARAARSPVHFVQADGVSTPRGVIVDPTGQAFSGQGG